MSNITGYSEEAYIAREAGEDVDAATIGAVKVSDQKIYKGVDSTGYIQAGVIQEETDAGDKVTLFYPVAWVDNSSSHAVAASNIGALCYVEDEKTVAISSNGSLIAGRILDYDSSKGVLVDFSQKSADTASAT